MQSCSVSLVFEPGEEGRLVEGHGRPGKDGYRVSVWLMLSNDSVSDNRYYVKYLHSLLSVQF